MGDQRNGTAESVVTDERRTTDQRVFDVLSVMDCPHFSQRNSGFLSFHIQFERMLQNLLADVGQAIRQRELEGHLDRTTLLRCLCELAMQSPDGEEDRLWYSEAAVDKY